MKKISKWRFQSVLCLLLVGGIFVSTLVMNPNPTIPVEDVYSVGAELKIPNYTISYLGMRKEATNLVTSPSGKVFQGDVLTLNELGKYELTYRADFNGITRSVSTTFLAQEKLYEVDKKSATASYGAHPYTPTVDGIMVSLNAGATFYYNDVIDLSKATKADKILELYVTPEVLGERDFEQIHVRFTDVYDEENYVDFTISASPAGIGHPVSYMSVGAANQPPTGLEYGWNRLHRYSRYGYAFDMSFYGKPQGATPHDQNGLEIAFDYAKREAHGKKGSFDETLVADLDSHDFYDELWNGFTTGEVKMQIWADLLAKANANFVIKGIAGQDLSRTYVEDLKGPAIEVDFQEYQENNLPKAVVNHPYSIFPSLARDGFSGVVATTSKVYFNYDGVPSEVPVTSKAFVPTQSGRYTIVYQAMDANENRTERLVQVDALAGVASPVLTIKNDGTYPISANVGEIVSLAPYLVSGGSGVVKTTVQVFLEGVEISVLNQTFKPVKEGNYLVVYTAKDYVGRTHTPEYSIQVTNSNRSFIYEDAVLPRYLIDSKEYTLPVLVATTYLNNQIQEANALIKVKDFIGETVLSNQKYTPRVANNGDTVTITYYQGEAEKSYSIPVFKTSSSGIYDLKKYFQVEEGVLVKANKDGVYFQTSKNNTQVDFISVLPATEFSLRFSIDKIDNFLSGVDVVLSDAVDPSIKIVASFTGNRTNPNGTELSVDGSKKYSLSSGFNGAGQFSLTYDDRNKIVYSEDSNVAVKLWDFTGFPSGKVYVSFILKDVISTSIVHVHNICSQIFSSVNWDLITPLVILTQESSGQRKKDETYVLKRAMAMDLLDPAITFHMTVKSPSGKIVKDVNGVNLDQVDPGVDYQFVLGEYGSYNITYFASDASENMNRRLVFVVVVDDVAPTLTYQGLMPKTAKVGQVIVASDAIASDNKTENITVYLYLVMPSGEIMKLPGNSFIALNEGTYTLRYMAFDQVGNTTIENFKVVVTE